MPVSWESLANDHILGIAPYEPGKPIEELEREFGLTDVIKLASNENPLPPSERVLKAISEALAHLNRYPDGSAHYLRIALARRHGLTPEHIIMGNGSNELIELLVRLRYDYYGYGGQLRDRGRSGVECVSWSTP